MAAQIGTDSGPLIPYSNLLCYCQHVKGQHALGLNKCDNCHCAKFRMDLSTTDNKSSDDDLTGAMCVTPEAANPTQTSSSETIKPVDEYRGSAVSTLKDSGQRIEFDSGMVRDVEDIKPGFHFLIPKDVPFDVQMLTRVAKHLREGAKKYTPRNWEKGNSDEEAERARESALRHMMQYLMGETDEDHAAAVIINIIFAETMQFKANKKKGIA